MPKLPRVSGADVIRALGKLRKFDSAAVTLFSNSPIQLASEDAWVPLHRELATGTLRGVLKQAEVSVEEFVAML